MFRSRKIFQLIVLMWIALSVCANPASAKDEAERLWELGEKAYEAGRYQEARSFYEKSLKLCGSNYECVASDLNGIGAVYEALDDDKKALTYYEQALAAAKKSNNRDLIATNLFNTGAVYHRTFNQYDRALSHFEQSLQIFRELKDSKSIATVQFNMGKVLNATGRSDAALSFLNESLKLNRELNNEQGIAGCLNLIGQVYARLGNYEKPLSYYQEALRINRKLNNQAEIAITLTNIGDAHCDLLETDKALGYYRDALNIQKRLNLRSDMALTLGNIGALYQQLNQYDKALSSYEESLKLSKQIENDALIAANLNNMGNTYATLGRTDEAISFYQQSLALERRIKRPYRIAITLNNIGMEYFRLGRYDEALKNLNEALKIERELNNPHNIAARLNNIGAVCLKQKRYAEAEQVFLERKAVGKRITGTRLIHAGLIEIYLEEKKYGEALSLLKELPPNWRDSRNRRMEYHTQCGLALKGRGEVKESAREFLKAALIIEEVRHAVGERSTFFAGGGYIGRTVPYRELAAVLAEGANRGERPDDAFKVYGRDTASSAFYFTEMTKARMLLERMADSVRQYNEPQIPAAIKNKEMRLLKELASIESSWEGAYEKGEAGIKRLQEKKSRLTDELDFLIADLRKNYPLYAALNYPKPIPAEELPLKENEVLIEFGIGRDSLAVFVLRKGGVEKVYCKRVSAEDLAEKIRMFLAPFNTGTPVQFSAKLGKELYDVLLADAVKSAKASDRLIIVPDGILGYLPFEALVVKNGPAPEFAGDKWTIRYSQSATALALTRLLKPAAAVKPLFAIGNPIYDKTDPRYVAFRQGKAQPAKTDLKQYGYRAVTLQPKPGAPSNALDWETVTFQALPETEDEIRAIAGLFGLKSEPPDILLGIHANETNLKNTDLKDYRYLHFATHADLPGKIRGIREPFIILGQVENGANADGYLTLSEVLGLKLNAEMVVLSACSTGKGQLTEGEGVANFARAFQHAGAGSVVVSLWEVASQAAVEYMKSFYGHLKSGKSKSDALALARTEIKAKYPNPFYWSVFVLYGEG